MSRETNETERPPLESGDARLVARLREAWSPEPLSGARRAAFDAGLEERLERARRRRAPWAALGAGLAAASVAALLVARMQSAGPPPVVAERDTDVDRPAAWAADLLYEEGEDAGELAADDEGLPAEYAAIAGVFLDR